MSRGMVTGSGSAAGSGAVPEESGGVTDILEIFDLEQLQTLQDRFSDATRVASLITRLDGTPITRPSNFCRLCAQIVRTSEEGRAACRRSDVVVGVSSRSGPTVRQCLSAGLWDAGASISVNGEHVANWLIGQVRASDIDDARVSAFVREIGADEAEFRAALAEVPTMSEKQFTQIADFLFVMAEELSTSAYENLEKTRLMAERERAAESLAHSEQRYRQLFERSPVGYQSLDAEGRFIIVNAAWLALLGYSKEEVLGKWFGDFLAPEYREAFRERFPIFKAAGRIHSEFEMIRKDGTVRFVGFDGVIGHDMNGEFQQTHCVLQDMTEERRATQALRDTNERLGKVLKSITATMGKVVETRDPYTQGHEQRVAILAGQIAEEMGLPDDDVEAIETAALVHDVGKLSVPTEILTRPGRLSATEFDIIKQHSRAGHDILSEIDFGLPIADIVLQHHERMDGSGYPDGLSGEEISMAARVLAVADVVEAMASHRPYRAALGLEQAVEEIRACPEKYDPRVTEAFLRLFEAGRVDL
jgi:PAS domain S-box-containing protein/putative nucleotidyltransferase with HDIG domain